MPEPTPRKSRQRAKTLLAKVSDDGKTYTVLAEAGIDTKSVRQAVLALADAGKADGLVRLTVTSERPISVKTSTSRTVQL